MTRRDQSGAFSRRDFVKVGVTAAAVAGMPQILRADEPPEDKKEGKKKKWSRKKDGGDKTLVPTRVLGKTGEKVSILCQGAGGKRDARMLNAAYDAGIRYIDTADCYARGESEKSIGEWMTDKGNRKEIFVVTKDHPKNPDEWVEMLDRRLKALQTDYVDMFFLHMVEAGQVDWLKSKDWAAAADKMKKSKKTRFVGLSTHAAMDTRNAALKAAAEGGWVDALMVVYDPQIVKDYDEFNKALDACAKAKVGLICMKAMRAVKAAPNFLPEFEKMGLTPHEAVLHAVWSDERISSICSDMPNLEILRANAAAAKKFQPLSKEKMPIPARSIPWRITILRILEACAPSAILTPSSCVRCCTE